MPSLQATPNLQIVRPLLHASRVLIELSNADIALATQGAPDLPRLMGMIDVRNFHELLLADLTSAILFQQHLVVSFHYQSVLEQAPPLSFSDFRA
jgi:hypothetical protein